MKTRKTKDYIVTLSVKTYARIRIKRARNKDEAIDRAIRTADTGFGVTFADADATQVENVVEDVPEPDDE